MIRKILAKLRNDCNINKLVKNGLKMGSGCSVARNAEIDYSHCWLVEIGNNVTITSRCIILAHDASMKRDLGYTKIAKVKIGNNVFIGVNSVVMPGTVIGDNTIIGAGSVVCGKVEPNSVYVGSPARRVCSKEEFLTKHKKLMDNGNVFDESYTTRQNVSAEKKEEMKSKLDCGVGYVE